MEGGYREAQHSKGAECTGRKPYIPNIENIVDRFEPWYLEVVMVFLPKLSAGYKTRVAT